MGVLWKSGSYNVWFDWFDSKMGRQIYDESQFDHVNSFEELKELVDCLATENGADKSYPKHILGFEYDECATRCANRVFCK